MLNEDYLWDPGLATPSLDSLTINCGPKVRRALHAMATTIGGSWGLEHIQETSDGRVYFELCPGYFSCKASVTPWSARQAWRLVRSAFGWLQVPQHHAESLGINIRKARTHGAHCIMGKKAWLALRKACIRFRVLTWTGIGVLRRSLRKNRTQAISCPLPSCDHNHGDSRPSFVVWSNEDELSGGGKCMVSGRTAALVFEGTKVKVLASLSQNLNTRRYKGVVDGHYDTAGEAGSLPSGSSDHGARRGWESGDWCIADWDWADSEEALPKDHCSHVRSRDGLRGRVLWDQCIRAPQATARAKKGAHYLSATLDGQGRWQWGSKLRGSLEEILERDHRRAGGWSAMASASYYEFRAGPYPERAMKRRLISAGRMKAMEWEEHCYRGKVVSIPCGWGTVAQKWLLFDLDNIEGLWGVDKESFMKWLREIWPGRTMAVWTGDSGIQVWLEMDREKDPELFRRGSVRRAYEGFGNTMLNQLQLLGGIGGKLDMSSFATCRWARRPSWRVLEGGGKFRSEWT